MGTYLLYILFISWIHRARKEEVLPYEYAELIAALIEVVRLIHSAAPDSQHAHVGFTSRQQQLVY